MPRGRVFASLRSAPFDKLREPGAAQGAGWGLREPGGGSGNRVGAQGTGWGLREPGGSGNRVAQGTGWLRENDYENSFTISGAAVVPPESPTSTNDATATSSL